MFKTVLGYGETAILPTPVVAVLGVIQDVRRRTPSGFEAAGDELFLLGATSDELSGSEWAHVVHGHLGGTPPRVDLAAERSLGALLVDGVGLLTSAHDLSDGGLAVALAESALHRGVGCSVSVSGDPFVGLHAESTARAIVTTTDATALTELAERHGVPLTRLGTTGGTDVVVEGQYALPVEEIRAGWAATLPAALG